MRISSASYTTGRRRNLPAVISSMMPLIASVRVQVTTLQVITCLTGCSNTAAPRSASARIGAASEHRYRIGYGNWHQHIMAQTPQAFAISLAEAGALAVPAEARTSAVLAGAGALAALAQAAV